jgi:ubiquinone/menaquinone biosynthesis C-methylase UbiE
VSDSFTVQAEFDRIALLPPARFDHNGYYHELLLRALPPRAGQALDLGCGTGEFTRLLAGRAVRVLGLDFSANMIRVARERSAGIGNIEFH